MDFTLNRASSSARKLDNSQLIKSNLGRDLETKPQSTKKSLFGLGIVFCIIAGCLFSFVSLVVKLITSINALQITFSRCFVEFCIVLPVCTYLSCAGKLDILGPPGKLKLLVLGGLTGSTSGLFLYQAIVRLSLGDAITIAYSNAIITSFLAYFILKEALTILDCILAVFTAVGIILIARPTFLFGSFGAELTTDKVAGLLFAISSAVMASISLIFVRKLGKETPAVLSVLFYSITGAFSAAAVLTASNTFAYPCFREIPYVFVLGILGVIGHIFLVLGLQYERASTVAVLTTLQIVFVFFLQVVVLHDIPSILSIVGSTLIFLSLFLVAIRKVYNQNIKKKVHVFPEHKD